MSVTTVRIERLNVGDNVTVRNAIPYELPKVLAQGTTVTVIGFRNCEYQVRDETGKEWHLPQPYVNSPQSYLWENQRWLPAAMSWCKRRWRRFAIPAEFFHNEDFWS